MSNPREASKYYPPELLNEDPSYYDCFRCIYKGVYKYMSVEDRNYSYPTSFFRDLYENGDLPLTLVYQVFFYAVLLTLIRYILTATIFIPFAKYMQLTETNTKKFPESAWKFLFYTVSFAVSFYVTILSGSYDVFQRPLHMWYEFHGFGAPMQSDLHLVYVIQCSFYIHSVFGTLYMDHVRKDTFVMLFHHLLTLCLIGFSYAVRYHVIGVLIVCLHDISDVCLEFTKINVYLKRQGKKFRPIHEHLSTIGFTAFAGTWALNRLYYYPLRVLYGAAWGPFVSAPGFPMPFYLFFQVLLWILQCLNFYWFFYISLFIWRRFTGQMKEVDDVREIEVNEELERERKKRETSSTVRASHMNENASAHSKVSGLKGENGSVHVYENGGPLQVNGDFHESNDLVNDGEDQKISREDLSSTNDTVIKRR